MKSWLGIVVVALLTAVPVGAQAQVAQWNQIVADKELERAFHRALREVSIDYINEMESEGTPAVITFVDAQLDYPLQLTTSDFRHVQLHAAQNKVAYLLRYQARTTRGVSIPLGFRGPQGMAGLGAGDLFLPFGAASSGAGYGGGAEIPGDGAMMLCPVNRNGLEFMYGGLSVATLDADGAFRPEEDGAAIERLHDRILELTYSYYGHTPQ